MAKLVYEGPDGVETREFGREDLTVNTETGYAMFQTAETDEGDPSRKYIPKNRIYSIEETDDLKTVEWTTGSH